MTIEILHPFQSAKADSSDAAKVRASNWNAGHTITLATDRLIGRDTSGSGAAEEITVSGGLEWTGSGGIQRSALTGDVTASAGSNTTTIANSVVTLAKMANLAQDTIIGRSTASTGVPQTITCTAAARALLDDTTVAAQQATLELHGQQTIWVPASAMIARTTNGAAPGSVETGTNRVMLKSLDFDTTTQEFAQFAIQMPKSWNEGTLIAQFVWSHPSTTTNFGVVWQLQAVSFGDNDAADTAFGTAQTATDTGGTTNNVYISPETAAITVAGSPAAEEWVVFQVARVPANASDTMAVDARLHGVKIHYDNDTMRDD